ncbi:MAG: glycosyltransferase family 2 protein [Deltaproteobacteria bacterium]|nr:glycosyltransferase family 2 protein [Deltaproteobacteria bacterium]
MSSISIIIPLYNKALFIERAIASVLRQTVEKFEAVVVDDGSTDGSGEVAENIKDPRLRIIRQENRGEGAARNRGIAAAQGDLIAFLDADDAWEPGFLAEIRHLREKFPQAGAFATAYAIISPQGKKEIPVFHTLPPDMKAGLIQDYFRQAYEIPVCASSAAVPKKVLEEIGGFPVGVPAGADLVTWLKIALRYRIAWSRECLACYYKNVGDRAARLKCESQAPVISQVARQAIAAGAVSPEQLEDLQEYAAFFDVITAVHCLGLGNKEMARYLLELSRGTKKFARIWWACRIIASIPGNLGPAVSWIWKIRNRFKTG